MEISPAFDSSYALRIIKYVLKAIEKLGDTSGFWDEKCIDSLEKIGGKEAIDILKDLAERYATEKHISNISNALRVINHLATNSDEEWYVKFIESNPQLHMFNLRRATQGLGKIGSRGSIAVIKEIARLHKTKEYITDGCYLSVENIYRATGTVREITEDDLFDK